MSLEEVSLPRLLRPLLSSLPFLALALFSTALRQSLPIQVHDLEHVLLLFLLLLFRHHRTTLFLVLILITSQGDHRLHLWHRHDKAPVNSPLEVAIRTVIVRLLHLITLHLLSNLLLLIFLCHVLLRLCGRLLHRCSAVSWGQRSVRLHECLLLSSGKVVRADEPHAGPESAHPLAGSPEHSPRRLRAEVFVYEVCDPTLNHEAEMNTAECDAERVGLLEAGGCNEAEGHVLGGRNRPPERDGPRLVMASVAPDSREVCGWQEEAEGASCQLPLSNGHHFLGSGGAGTWAV
mmetsp:Transcript_4435/g.15573  ORF Transcript_4435/g.15573 Transcript_4435/m.15573 type:complete len:291 (-) Transcript_4435:472-1344(-)